MIWRRKHCLSNPLCSRSTSFGRLPRAFSQTKACRCFRECGLPDRFLIYTPPPPLLKRPKTAEKEGQFHKVQRQWEGEIQEAKTSAVKTMFWKGIRAKRQRASNWGISQTKSSSAEFPNRLTPSSWNDNHGDDRAEDIHKNENTKATVKLEDSMLVYPSSMPKDPDQLRQELVNTMQRFESKAAKDAIIATSLLPLSFAIDTLATPVWPFGGLPEIDAVGAYASIHGAKTSRSVTRRLASTLEKTDERSVSRLLRGSLFWRNTLQLVVTGGAPKYFPILPLLPQKQEFSKPLNGCLHRPAWRRIGGRGMGSERTKRRFEALMAKGAKQSGI